MRLILASRSPRRSELLQRLSLRFETIAADVDETRRPGELPGEYVDRVATAKAMEVAGPGLVVIGCDTAVVHEGKILGKPGHPQEARSMLVRLQGEIHEVFTGMAVVGWSDGPVVHSVVDVTETEFLPMTEDEIDDYVASGEPMDKAGAYALQGVGGVFIRRISGSPFTVIGMPIHLLPRLIAATGADLATFKTT